MGKIGLQTCTTEELWSFCWTCFYCTNSIQNTKYRKI